MAMFTYEDILAKINSGNEQNNSNATVRLNAIPLDKSTIYDSYDAAKTYATTAGNAYEGQLIAVKNNGQQEVYVLDSTADDGLRKLASGGSADEISKKLGELSSQLLSADGIIDQLSTAHNALSVALSTEISAETIARDEAVKALSVALSTDIGALSVALSTEISAEAIARDEAVKALSVALSTDVDSLSTRLSTEISALNSNADKAIEDLSTALSTDIDSLSTRLSTEVEALSTALSTDVDSLSTRLSTDVKALSVALSTDVDSLSVRLSTEISAETKAREDAIKALENKLSSTWQFRGTVDAAANEDNVEKIEAQFTKPQSGDVVIVNKKFVDEDGTESTAAIEYAFDGTDWQQLGDESSNVSKFQLKSAVESLSVALSTDVDSLSVRLSTEISAEAIARDEAVKALSVALSTDVDSLSTRLSTEISALNANADKAVEDLSIALSTDVDSLSTRLSTEISAEAIARDEAVKALSVALSTDVDSLSVRLSTEISVLNANADKAVEDLSVALSTDVDSLSTRLSTEIDSLSVALSTDLSAEIEARKENDTYLSTKIDSKILAQIGDDAEALSVDTLTIHKISVEKYAELLATPGGIVDTDLYVVSSENTDAYGHKVINVADAEDDGDAVNYGQFKALSAALSTDVKLSVETLEQKIEEAVEGGVEALSTELLDATTGKIPLLDAKVNEISSNLSDEIEALSSALSTDIDTLSADVYKDLSVAMTTTAGAADGDVLSTFTFTQNGKTIGTINLPKDKVIDSAQVVFGTLADGTFTPEDEGSETKSEAAKFYLEVVVANQTDKLYIPVPELADTYVGHTGTYIAVTVQSDDDGARCISADIRPNSITNDKMADDSITMRNLSGEFIFNCGDAFGYIA